jgi:hypothetical protein
MHRSDAHAAAVAQGAGLPRTIAHDPAFAQDGIAEMLHGFAARRSNAIAQPGVLALRADDGPHWRVEFGGERILAGSDDAPDADATVAGSSSDIYLWLWNRPSDVHIMGDQDVAARWRTVRVRWS